jgi:long-chain acyl-CoA synthetase
MGATVTGTIGYPSPSIEFRFVDVEDAGYKAAEGVGEIWLRGPSLLRGYHKRPDINKESLTDDGWFKTGDVGKINADGTISITDRIKNLVKLAHGEYVAIENLESKYRNCNDIKNICIVAENGKDFILAAVEPSSPDIEKSQLLKSLQNTARESRCSRVEIIHDIFISTDDWSKNGFMTTSEKLKRNIIKEAFKDQIKEAYSKK